MKTGALATLPQKNMTIDTVHRSQCVEEGADDKLRPLDMYSLTTYVHACKAAGNVYQQVQVHISKQAIVYVHASSWFCWRTTLSLNRFAG